MPVRPLPSNPSLDHLKHQAKDLLRDHSAGSPHTAQRIREFHPRFSQSADADIFSAPFKLGDAQLTIARERGFSTWARLKRHIETPTLAGSLHLPHQERIEDPTFRRAVDLIDAGDTEALRTLLKQHPPLVHQHLVFEGGNYFRMPTLLDFIAENPVRHSRLPPNIVEVARVILEAGPDLAARNEALALVATGSVARECNVQLPLIDLLCAFGADPGSAVRMAAILNEHASVHALLNHGAELDLPTAAALGRESECGQMLANASPDDRHLALSAAAQFGHAAIVRLLLDAGEDPDRYSPPGGHSHGTPLHHAAGGGHDAVVRLLVERGARLDLRDVLWHATPADWAAHGGKKQLEEFLRRSEKERYADKSK